jgi:hypothetical protein
MISVSSVHRPRQARRRERADDRLMLTWRGRPRVVLGVFPDWQTIDRYVEREAASVRRRDEAGPGAMRLSGPPWAAWTAPRLDSPQRNRM